MNYDNIPIHFKHFINGYCKKQTKLLIPLCLKQIIMVYFVFKIKQILFSIQFNYQQTYASKILPNGEIIRKSYDTQLQILTSIYSTFIISNQCHRLIIHVGKRLQIEIYLSQSFVKMQENVFKLKQIANDETEYKIDTSSTYDIEITFQVNRCTLCPCLNSDGSIQIHFRKYSNANMKIQAEANKPNAYVELLLKDFDYTSNENVSIETLDTDKIRLISNQNSIMPCDQFGFGRQCCFWAAYQYSDSS